ncbi:40S ribosomal protein S11-like isoform X2 [Alligator sinensis]|uniref:Small ribosomal subunit protein uS17 n=1 Tax=Alligator sinensis TaxID=38654 RepID=A0A3Q0FT19_ALLSI|nr:40S ribosomal protein S11-like isoform X2 [Alligator sinensis]
MCPFLAQHGALFNPAKLGSLLKQQLEIMASLREEAGKLPCQEGGEALEQAIESTYIDKKCTFTGNVSSRGHILLGAVTEMKMQRTIVIRRDFLHYICKYNRFEKRHKNMPVHLSPCFRAVQMGDIVTVGECRTHQPDY